MTNLQRCFYLMLLVTSALSAQLIANLKRTKDNKDSSNPFDENEKYSSEKTSDSYGRGIGKGVPFSIVSNRADRPDNSSKIIIPEMPGKHSSRKLLAANSTPSSASDCSLDYNCSTAATLNNDSGGNATRWNESYEDYMNQIEEFIFPRSWTWILIFIHSLVFVIGLVGNTLVCVSVYRNHTMRTVTNYFIVNLAVADFMVILFCLPPTLIWDVTMTWFFGVTMCKIVLYLQVGEFAYLQS